MAFSTVVIYNLDGDFLGYSIKDDQSLTKLHTANLWTEGDEDVADLRAQLSRLNDAVDIRAYWPDVRDPDVVALLANPDFEPLTLSPVEIEDEENSVRVWEIEPDWDNDQPGILDLERSAIAYKSILAPSPAAAKNRVKNACEVVARRRASAS